MKMKRLFQGYEKGDVCTGLVQSTNGLNATTLKKEGIIEVVTRKTPELVMNQDPKTGEQRKGSVGVLRTEEYVFMGFDQKQKEEQEELD